MVGEIIGAVVLGIIAGYLARLLVPGKQDIGFLMTVALGIGGAIVGYFFFTELLGIGDDDKFDLGGLIGAVIGSIILLLIYIKFVRPSTDHTATVEPADREDASETAIVNAASAQVVAAAVAVGATVNVPETGTAEQQTNAGAERAIDRGEADRA